MYKQRVALPNSLSVGSLLDSYGLNMRPSIIYWLPYYVGLLWEILALYNENLSLKMNNFMMILISEVRLSFSCLLLATCIHLQANSKRFYIYNNIVLRCNCALDKQILSNGYGTSDIMIMAGFLHPEMSKC
jgi:hypothetical protein